MATIKSNQIHFPDHMVVCAKAVADANYMEMMEESLSPNGSAADHKKELRAMNNDGSWQVRMLKKVTPTPQTKIAGINYWYKQGNGRKARRHVVCSQAELQTHITRLEADPKAKIVEILGAY